MDFSRKDKIDSESLCEKGHRNSFSVFGACLSLQEDGDGISQYLRVQRGPCMGVCDEEGTLRAETEKQQITYANLCVQRSVFRCLLILLGGTFHCSHLQH